MVEKSTKIHRGGNSSLTMNFRFFHNNFEQLLSLIDDESRNPEIDDSIIRNYIAYSSDDFLSDLILVSGGRGDTNLQKVLATKSLPTIQWMRELGHKWIYKGFGNTFKKSLPLKIDGCGSSLQERNFAIAEKLGIDILYSTSFLDFVIENKYVQEIILMQENNKILKLETDSLIMALGGYESNAYLREKFLGKNWKDIAIRGVSFNTGDWFFPAIKNNLQLYGDYSHFGCHATPQSSNLPNFLLPKENVKSQNQSRYQFNLGITVNSDSKRFLTKVKICQIFYMRKLVI